MASANADSSMVQANERIDVKTDPSSEHPAQSVPRDAEWHLEVIPHGVLSSVMFLRISEIGRPWCIIELGISHYPYQNDQMKLLSNEHSNSSWNIGRLHLLRRQHWTTDLTGLSRDTSLWRSSAALAVVLAKAA
jgi:hypothetical protein